MGTSALDTSTCWYSETSQPDIETDQLNFPTNGELYSGAGVSNPITYETTGSWPVSQTELSIVTMLSILTCYFRVLFSCLFVLMTMIY